MKQNSIILLTVLLMSISVWSNVNTQDSDSVIADLTKLTTSELLTLAEQNDAVAQYYLSQRYAIGEGVEQDDVQAYKWALLAERNGVAIFGSRQTLEQRMTPEQIQTAQALADMFVQTNAQPVKKFVSDAEGFSVLFPSAPKRTVLQDNARLYAVHYQAQSEDGSVQYNVSVQSFKEGKIQEGKAQTKFLNEYLAGRSMFAWKNQIQKKMTKFNGCTAAMFKHKTFSGPTEMTHEGVTFLADGDAITLSCVYPSANPPALTFQDYIDSFELHRGVK